MVQILIAMGASLTAENANGYDFYVSSVLVIFKIYIVVDFHLGVLCFPFNCDFYLFHIQVSFRKCYHLMLLHHLVSVLIVSFS